MKQRTEVSAQLFLRGALNFDDLFHEEAPFRFRTCSRRPRLPGSCGDEQFKRSFLFFFPPVHSIRTPSRFYTILVTPPCSFVIDLPTRRVEIAGTAPVPNGLWMHQVARNLIDDVSGFLRGKGFLIHDRDPLYTRAFRQLLSHAGVTSVRLPPRSPNLNAHAERFVLSIKSECLDRMVLIGERHLRRAIGSYLEHYHLERCHQGLGNRPIEGVPKPSEGMVLRHERLGGILSHYYRQAA